MSIIIKGMEMPTSCYKCPMRRRDRMDIVCPIAHERFSVADVNILDCRLDSCPLVPVPPHGRLIDADALVRDNGIKEIPEYYEVVCAAPTIIPAESNAAEEEKNDK